MPTSTDAPPPSGDDDPTGQATRFSRLMDLVGEATDRPEAEREAFLRDACGGDDALREEAQRLVEKEGASGGYFDRFVDRMASTAERVFETETVVGSEVGAFRIVRHLGEGGMGQVYLGERTGRINQRVAIKIIKRGMDSDAIVRRFRLEQQILAALHHPGISRLVDAGVTQDGRSYLVMDYVEGVRIDRYCDDHKLSVDERIVLFLKVCDAVHYAHQNLVIHRDLKPGNILVREDGRPILLDFGIAKLVNPDLSGGVDLTRTLTQARLMTPEYASPEQVAGGVVTTSSDVYALGVLLYELLTGHRPYHVRGCTASEVERIICETSPRRPSTVVTDAATRTQSGGVTHEVAASSIAEARGTEVGALRHRLRGDIDTVLLKALRKEPALRYDSVAQFCEDLKNVRAGLPVQARPATVRYRLGLFVRRHRALATLGSIAGLLLVAYVITALVQAQRIEEEAERAQREAQRAGAVNQFMHSLFAQVDPELARGDTLTAYQLLERGERTVRTELASQPRDRSTMLRVIGDLYHELGQLGRARELLQEALREAEASFGPDHIETARTLDLLARSYLFVGDGAAEAEAYLDRAIAIAESQLRADRGFAAQPYRRRSEFYRRNARADDARHDALRALDLSEKYGDPADIRASRTTLAALYKEEGNPTEALRLFRIALADAIRSEGPESVTTAQIRSHIAQVLYSMDALGEASLMADNAARTFRQVYGPSHIAVARIENLRGGIAMEQSDAAAAYQHYAAALEGFEGWVGEENQQSIASLQGMASAAYRMDSLGLAMEHWQHALDLISTYLSPEHPSRASVLVWMAHASNAAGDYDEAAARYREAIGIREAALGERHYRTLQARILLARVYYEQQRYPQARDLLDSNLPILRDVFEPDHSFIVNALRLRADLYAATGAPDSAAALRARLPTGL